MQDNQERQLFATEFYRQYNRPSNLLRLVGGINKHIFTTWLWPTFKTERSTASWYQRLAIDGIQYNYKWHINRASVEPLPYERIWNKLQGDIAVQSERRHWSSLTVKQQQVAKHELIVKSGMKSEAELRAYCCVRNFQQLIDTYLRPIQLPYYPWADMHRLRLPRIIDYESSNGCGYQSLQIDIVRHRSVSRESARAVLFVHGGAYCFRIESTWRPLCMHYSAELGAQIIIPHYRLAPDNPWPAALHDCMAAYLFMVRDRETGGMGLHPDQIALIGESAGAGALVALCLQLASISTTLIPRAAYLQSPWLDLSCSTTADSSTGLTSWQRNHRQDLLHQPVWPFDLAKCYFNGLSECVVEDRSRNPLVSPFFADCSVLSFSLPRNVLIQVGAIDSLHDEGLLLAKRLHEQRQLDCAWLEHIQDPQSAIINSESGNQNSIKCEIYSDMPHVFQLFWPLGNQMSRLAVQRGCRFINKSLTE